MSTCSRCGNTMVGDRCVVDHCEKGCPSAVDAEFKRRKPFSADNVDRVMLAVVSLRERGTIHEPLRTPHNLRLIVQWLKDNPQ